MEVLFLCHRLPYPPNKGDKIRSHALLTHLAKHHRVHLACFIDDPADFVHADTVRAIAGGECLFVPLHAATKWSRAAMALLKGRSDHHGVFRECRDQAMGQGLDKQAAH